jgi:predicted transposase YbfD/YdcC
VEQENPILAVFLRYLDGVPDPRKRRGQRHRLTDVLAIAFLAAMCGADDAEAIEDWGDTNATWLGTFLELNHGIPSQDTFLRVLGMLDPTAFKAFFEQWVDALTGKEPVGHVAIDGKTLRGSFDGASGKTAIHMVHAWACEKNLLLGQVKTAEKSNEITAIPELMRLLDLRKSTVTIDAMGCQRDIAATARERDAHYALAVKDNQPTLRENIAGFFADAARTKRTLDEGPAPVVDEARDTDKGHGRIEERRCVFSRDLSWVEEPEKWKDLTGIGMVEATRTSLKTGKVSSERRYYIVSNPKMTAASLNDLVRAHWGIENKLHWVLDTAFDEDRCRTRKRHSAENLAIIRRLVLNILSQVPDAKKRSMRRRRRMCSFSRTYLLDALGIGPTS